MDILAVPILKSRWFPDRPVLLMDCDGVLTDWFSQLKAFHESLGLSTYHLCDELLQSDMYESVSDIFPASSEEQSLQLCEQYNDSAFIADLGVMERGSPAALQRLSRTYELIVITTIGDKMVNAMYRRKNLEDIYGPVFSDILCLPFQSDKLDTIRAVSRERTVAMWLDDDIEGVKQGIEVGVPSFQYRYASGGRPRSDGIPSFRNWLDIENYLAFDHKQVAG